MSAGQIVGGVVGAVIGFYAGGPVGALQGAALGAGVGGYLDPPKGPTVSGPRLNDLAVQTSTYGAFIPRVYGTIGIHGNLLWLENNQLKETVRKKQQGGKGGGSSATVKTYSYSATFHLGLCEGPIAGVRRIWCADKLIYNAGSDDLETIIASNQNAAGFRIYLGSDDQMPDSRYEADVGVGNASSHRGMAYIAFYDFQLADYSNTLQAAQFKVEVVDAPDYTRPELIGVEVAKPQTSFWFAGSPGGSLQGAYFGNYGFIDTALSVMNGNGQLSPIPLPPTITHNDYAVAIALSLDTTYQWFYKQSLGTRAMLSYGASGWAIYTSNYAMTNHRIVERAGNVWFMWGNDTLNPDPAPDGTAWVSRMDDAGLAGLQIVNRLSVSSSGIYCASASREFVSVHFDFIDIGAIGLCSVSVYDETALIRSGSFTLGPTTGMMSQNFSRGYVDDAGLLHLVCQLYRQPTPLPSIYGHFHHAVFDITSMQLVKQEVLVSPTLAHFHPEPDMLRVEDGMLYLSAQTNATNTLWRVGFALDVMETNGQPLAEIISREIELSGYLSASDISVSGITAAVRGYRITGGTIRAALEPLQGAFPFDVIQSGYKIKCVPRGQASIAIIPWEDLGATDGDTPGDILQQSREMDSQLSARTTIKYLDAVREYAISEQYAERINTEAINRVDRELPLVLTADEAAGVAEVLQNLPWLERTDAAFSLPPIYLHLEPSDVVTVTTPQATYQLRLTEINYTPDGRPECKAKPNRAALYTPAATGGEGVPPNGTVPLLGNSLFLPLDIPVVDEALQNAIGFVGVMTGDAGSWPGGLLVRSNDDGQTWSDLQGFNGKATLGIARGTLPSSPCTLVDQRALIVDMLSGEPESVTRDQMLSGVNYAAYGLDGRWEIVRFQSAALQGSGSYLLSGFVRGEKGTEWATGLHAVGDYFVLLDDPDNAFIGSPVESIAMERLYRGVTSGALVDGAVDVPFTYRGVNLECPSPIYAKGVRDGSSNFTGTFTRRSRLSSSWWTTGVVAPVGEASESYEIDVMNGSAAVRTLTASAPTFNYSAANQTADFGSAQSSITFRIYQLSATVGRGLPLEVTL